MKPLHRLLLAALLPLLFSALAEARGYKVGTVAWIAYSPLNVADAKGFWKDQGLEVEVITFGTNQELNSAVENKRIDYALDMLGTWAGMYAQGAPIKILGETDWSNGGDKIIAKQDVDLTKLKGQTLGVYLNQPSVTFFLNKFLATNGLKLSDVEIVEMDPVGMSDNFISGRLPMIVNYDPEALRAEREGKGKLVATSATYAGVIPEGFAGHADVIKAIPEADQIKFFTGWLRAVKWSKDPANWNEYREILNGKTFGSKNSDEDLKAMLASVLVHDAKEQLARNQPGGGVEQYLGELKGFLDQNGLLKKPFAPGEVLARESLLKALQAKP